MGYRGSKSVTTLSITVKEQRVDGSWHISVFKGYSKRFRKKFINLRIYFFFADKPVTIGGVLRSGSSTPP